MAALDKRLVAVMAKIEEAEQELREARELLRELFAEAVLPAASGSAADSR
jgi:hypothetical protein